MIYNYQNENKGENSLLRLATQYEISAEIKEELTQLSEKVEKEQTEFAKSLSNRV